MSQNPLNGNGICPILLRECGEEVAQRMRAGHLRTADSLRYLHQLLADALFRDLAHLSQERAHISLEPHFILDSAFPCFLREFGEMPFELAGGGEGLYRLRFTLEKRAIEEKKPFFTISGALQEDGPHLLYDRQNPLVMGLDVPEHPRLAADAEYVLFEVHIGNEQMRQFADAKSVKRQREEDAELPLVAGRKEIRQLLRSEKLRPRAAVYRDNVLGDRFLTSRHDSR